MKQKSIVDEMFAPKKEGDVPFFYAKMHLPTKYSHIIHPKGLFRGLKRVVRSGRVVFEEDPDWCLQVDGETGYCKIPDTEHNRNEFKRMSSPKQRKVIKTKVEWNAEGIQEAVQYEAFETDPPLFEMIEESAIEKNRMKSLEEQLQELAQKKGMKIVFEPVQIGTKEVTNETVNQPVSEVVQDNPAPAAVVAPVLVPTIIEAPKRAEAEKEEKPVKMKRKAGRPRKVNNVSETQKLSEALIGNDNH